VLDIISPSNCLVACMLHALLASCSMVVYIDYTIASLIMSGSGPTIYSLKYVAEGSQLSSCWRIT